MYLEDIGLSQKVLDEYLDRRLIRVREHPVYPYLIYNYTESAQSGRMWDHVTRTCRGLIVEKGTGRVIARPFPKFFNYGEESGGKSKYGLSEPVVVTDKIDGSLGIMYPDNGWDGYYSIATRGSFESEQAKHATELLQRKYTAFRPPLGKTLLFEIVYPRNRIVLNYGEMDDLVLLGMVDNETGVTYGPSAVPDWPGPRARQFSYKTFGEALGSPPRLNAEGLVVHFVDRDVRVKLKQDDYVQLHKIVTGLNEHAVWERIQVARKLADVYDGIPDEFHTWLTDVVDKLFDDFDGRSRQVFETFHEAEDNPDVVTRKDYALRWKDYPGWMKAALFKRLDFQPYAEILWKSIEPKGTS